MLLSNRFAAVFAAGASLTRLALVRSDLIRQLGEAVFLPNIFGWAGAVFAVAAAMIIWYLLSGWNEQRRSADVLRL